MKIARISATNIASPYSLTVDLRCSTVPEIDFAHLLAQGAAAFVGFVAMHNNRKRVHNLAIDTNVQFNQRPSPEVQKFVVERRVSAAYRLQTIVKIKNNLRERQLVMQDHALV